MKRWNEVTDPAEIARFNRKLKRRLMECTRPGGRYLIGYPSGDFIAPVRIAQGIRGRKFWTCSGLDEKNADFFTLFGRCEPGQDAALLIDLQFNFPSGRFSRQKGGAFVKDESGRVFLAHRGIVAKGNARLNKEDLFRSLDELRIINATSDAKPTKVELFLVANLDDEDIARKIGRFAAIVRAAANLVALERLGAKRRDVKLSKKLQGETLDLVLSGYRDEFTGASVSERKSSVVMTWNHGKVVRALRKELSGHGEQLKSKATDLVIRRRLQIDLFEVKTSPKSQSVYTAIGQLVFNGNLLQRAFPMHSIRRYLVMPDALKHAYRQALCRELGFELITFKPKASGYTFIDLPSKK